MKRLINFVPYCIIAMIALGIIYVSIDKPTVISSSNEFPIVIIDAGHGGDDGGAVASDGTQEQYINLDISLKLNDLLSSAGYTTLMTRTDDNSIHDPSAKTIREKKVSDIHNRLKIITTHENCIFVSIHQNFFTQSQYHGAQVFYSPNNEKSEILAQVIQSSIVEKLQPDNSRQIKKADSSIYVLHHSTAPSVLVECGFLSNPEETVKLNDEEYRAEMAEAIFNGIEKYLCNQTSENEVSSASK